MRTFLKEIDENKINGEIIAKIIEKHKPIREKCLLLYERYKASVGGVPILSRRPAEYRDFETDTIKRLDDKVNNRLNNAFDAEIVDTKIGYMLGSPISYEPDEGAKVNESMKQALADFVVRNNVSDKDAELGKKAAICGYAARLAYIDPEGNERIMNIDPWEAVFLTETDYTEPKYALRYFFVDEDTLQAEFYDRKKYYIFQSKNNGVFTAGKSDVHTFDFCPLFGFPNNEEMMADAEKVFTLIDAYDRTLSDANNEIEQFRLAYLVVSGAGVDDEELQEANRRSLLELPDDTSAEYLTKDVNDTMIENHLDRLEENILRFSKSVNFSDEAFGGNISGIAMRFKLMALENKCIATERKMTAALRYQFKVICSAWAKRNICSPDDYLSVWFGFTRNLPANLLDEAQTTAQLKGFVSEKTRLSLLSFVDDVDYEMEQMDEDSAGTVDLDQTGGDSSGQTQENRGGVAKTAGKDFEGKR